MPCIVQLDLPHHRPKPLYVPVTRNNESTFCTRDQYLAPRVAFISWLVTFFLEKKYVNSAAAAQSTKNGTEVIPKIIQVSVIVSLPGSKKYKYLSVLKHNCGQKGTFQFDYVSLLSRLSLQAVAARRRKKIRHQTEIQVGQWASLRRVILTAAHCQIEGPAIPVCVALKRSTAVSMTWCMPSCCPPGIM